VIKTFWPGTEDLPRSPQGPGGVNAHEVAADLSNDSDGFGGARTRGGT